MPATPLSAGARQWRTLMWASVALAAAGFLVAWQGARGRVDPALGILALGAAGAALLLALLAGARARRQALEDRAEETGSMLLVMLAAQLKTKDDATLEALVAKGGQAGEAAALVLQGRRERARPAPPQAG